MRTSLIGIAAAISAVSAAAQVPTPDRPVTDPRSVVSTTLTAAPAISAERLLSLPSIDSVAWSADDQGLFVSANLSGRYNIWRTSADGGWPIRLTESNETQRQLAASPDGKALFFVQDHGGDENYDIYSVATAGGIAVNLTASADVSEADIRLSPRGALLAFTHKRRGHPQRDIAIMDIATRQVRNLTGEQDPSGCWSVAGWSRNGARLYANRENGLLGGESAVWEIDVASGRRSRLTPDRPDGRDFAVGTIDDGKRIVLTSNQGGARFRAGLYDPKAGTYRWFKASAWEQVAFAVSPDHRSILYGVREDGRIALRLVDATTQQDRPIDLPEGLNTPVLSRFTVGDTFSHDSKRLVISHASGDTPTDVRVVDPSNGSGKIVVRATPPGIGPGYLPRSSIVTYRSFDGTLVSGILTMPFNLRRDASNPAIVIPHGGPTVQAEDGFDAKAALLASRGYLVLRPNYRGSTGYGLAFMKAERNDLGGGDLKDVVEARNFLIATGYVAPSSVGITGSSAGGWLTMLALGKYPGLFKAGVQVYGILDWLSAARTADPLLSVYLTSLLGPSTDEAAYKAASPITYLQDLRAPLLSLAGVNDVRVPIQQAEVVDAALKARGRISELVKYEGEGHGFRKRENQIDELNRTADWFDQYLRH